MSDDGPVAMIQIENEYGHVGGRTGEEGEAHMRMLRQVAKEVGLKVPDLHGNRLGRSCDRRNASCYGWLL